MRSTLTLARATAVAIAVGSLVGCFNPTIKDGGFRCDPTQTPACPDGFVCVGGVCRNSATSGGSGDDMAGTAADGGDDMAQAAGDMRHGSSADLAMGGGSCAHALCTTGTKLTQSCDPCVSQICAQDSYCCITKWSSQCVSEVTSICGRSCP